MVDVDERSHDRAHRVRDARRRRPRRTLNARGLTLGHFPQSFEFATVGGCVATRSAGQASTGYGRIDDMVVGVRCAAPAGELDLRRSPGQRGRARSCASWSSGRRGRWA